ncbi:hypothetical protein MWU61_17965 [Loktanella sp. F6476L]|uniref:hypothetical protein n=1 Tax=Loktanella sp. F6476L TaxID=2926405 RepID=UPI001FF593C7|nr:hypothetical protein [Loktanella sp. F6476L]MCK0122447.1 hypothetical protein [Loktanella sp. F6476L]
MRQLAALRHRFIESLDGDDEWAAWYFDEFVHLVLSLPAVTDHEIYWLMRIGYIKQIRIDNLPEFLTCKSRQKWAGRKIALKLANSELSSQT